MQLENINVSNIVNLYSNDILIDEILLKSKHYIEDIKHIGSAVGSQKVEYLTCLSRDVSSLKSDYHTEDIRTLFISPNDGRIEYLYLLSKNEKSLLNPYHHLNDMNLILMAKSVAIAKCLYKLAIFEKSLETNFHKENMELIANAVSDERALYILEASLNVNCLNNEKIIRSISSAKTDIIAKHMKELVCDDEFNKSSYYDQDLKLLQNSKTDIISECLKDVALSTESIDSPYHEEDMQLIANAKSDVIASCLADVAMNADSLASPYHKEDMQLIANAKSDAIAMILSEIATSEKSLNCGYHGNHLKQMKLIAESKYEDVAICYGLLSCSEDEECYNEYLKYVDTTYDKNNETIKHKVKPRKVVKK